MATMRLVPSTIYNGASSYLTISNASNAYTNTDSTTYATIQNTNASTSSRYIYLRGFNFDDIPNGAIVSEFTIKLKGYESGISTSSSYQPYLANGTTAINGSCSPFGTSSATRTFSGVSADWDTIKGYGNNFGIRINCRRASRNTVGYVYLQGAEIEVTYTVPNPRTITSTLTGNGTINPSGAQTYYDGDEYNLIITPTNQSDTVTVTNNGIDVTSQLVPPGSASGTEEQVLGTYALTSGGFNGSGATYFSGLVGKGYNNASQTTSNYYSSGNGTIAVFTYDMPIEVPIGATISECYVMVNGHAESTSQSSEYMCAQLYAGSTAISNELNFKSVGTSNSTQTIQATTLPTVAQCADLKLQCRLGYYGGAINGATVFVTYSYSTDYYTYTYTVSGNATIAVTIGTPSGPTQKIFFKNNGTWVQYSKVYIKQNGTWVEQSPSNWSSIFDTTKNYVKG